MNLQPMPLIDDEDNLKSALNMVIEMVNELLAVRRAEEEATSHSLQATNEGKPHPAVKDDTFYAELVSLIRKKQSGYVHGGFNNPGKPIPTDLECSTCGAHNIFYGDILELNATLEAFRGEGLIKKLKEVTKSAKRAARLDK